MRAFLLILCVTALGLSVLVWSATEDAGVVALLSDFMGWAAIQCFLGAAGVWCFWFSKGKTGWRVLLWLPGAFLLFLFIAQYVGLFSDPDVPGPFGYDPQAGLQWWYADYPRTSIKWGAVFFPVPGATFGLIWGIPAVVAVPVIGNWIRQRRHRDRMEPTRLAKRFLSSPVSEGRQETRVTRTTQEKGPAAKAVVRHGLGILALAVGGIVGIAGGRMAIDWLYSPGEESAEWAAAVPEGFSAWSAEFKSAAGPIDFGPGSNDLLSELYRAAPNEFAAWMDAKVALPPTEFTAWQAASVALYNAAPEGWKRWENAVVAWGAAPNEQNESEMVDALIALEAVAPTIVEAYLAADIELAEGWANESAAYAAASQALQKTAPQQYAALADAEARAGRGNDGE